MAGTSTTTTRALQVHDQLRADILSGRYAPGRPLRLAELAQQYGVSMSLVREALLRLSEQNLTVLTPNSGFRIREVSRKDLVDLTDLRVMLEGRAIQRSIECGDVVWEAQVVAAHHVLERAQLLRDGEPGTTEEWSLAHAAFHDALISACDSPRLIDMTRSLRDSAEMYRQLSERATLRVGRDVAAEHRELLELATSRRSKDAEEALSRHLRVTSDLILADVLVDP